MVSAWMSNVDQGLRQRGALTPKLFSLYLQWWCTTRDCEPLSRGAAIDVQAFCGERVVYPSAKKIIPKMRDKPYPWNTNWLEGPQTLWRIMCAKPCPLRLFLRLALERCPRRELIRRYFVSYVPCLGRFVRRNNAVILTNSLHRGSRPPQTVRQV